MERSTGVFDCLMNLMQKERESGDLPPCNKDERILDARQSRQNR